MSYILAVLIVLFGLLLIEGGLRYAKFRARCANEYQRGAQDFYGCLEPLAQDDETPELLVRRMAFLNRTIDDKSAAFNMIRVILHQRSQPRRDFLPSETEKIEMEFFHRRPELEAPYQRAHGAWFYAITANCGLMGFMARYMMSQRDIPPAAAEVVERECYARDLTAHAAASSR